MPTVVKKKTEITAEDLHPFKPEWTEHWKEWVIIDDGIVFTSYDSEEEASKIASLLLKARQVKDSLQIRWRRVKCLGKILDVQNAIAHQVMGE